MEHRKPRKTNITRPDYGMGMTQANIGMIGPEWKAFQRLAREQGITASCYVRKLIRRELMKSKRAASSL